MRYTPRHDRGHMSLICFAPELLARYDICVIRVSPSCRFIIHVVRSPKPDKQWICLLTYNEHMRLSIPGNQNIVAEIVRSPQSVAQPVGWKALLERGPHEVTIATKCLSRCPHCQIPGVRLPLGIEGSIVWKSVLLTGPELRGFSSERPRTEETAKATGPEAHQAWKLEQTTPPLGSPENISSHRKSLLLDYVNSAPVEEESYDECRWTAITEKGDSFLYLRGVYTELLTHI